jgi:hypothetical protein
MKKMDTQFLTNRTLINGTDETSDTHKKKSLKEEIMEEVTEKFMKKILEMVKQKVQEISRYHK